MVAQIAGASDWVARPLTDFAIRKMTEVYRVNEDGTRTESVGYFKNEDVAKAYAGQHSAPYLRTGQAFILTNGTLGFLLANDAVYLFDDEALLVDIREKALAKLSDEERKILGFL
ncbi:MAG: hypothetical protein AAB835_02030 [Patescibacteria group bacterium]